MAERIYLDWNATTPLRPEARTAMVSAMDVVGNPSSVHAEGRAAKGLIEAARHEIAEALGARPQEVIFTAGSTESASVLRHFASVSVDPSAHSALYAWHNPPETGPAAIHAMGLANSETGVITEPAAEREGLLLLDATQAIGRLPFAFGWSGADLAIASAHKFGGPKGIGVLLARQGLEIPSLLPGGGQEMNRRSGTENLLGIVGMAAALKAAVTELTSGLWREAATLRDALEAHLAAEIPDLIFAGKDQKRLPNTSCMVLPGWKGETQVMQMDLAGIAVSAGSACSSGKVRPSRVLTAMGFDDLAAASSIRVSMGAATSQADLDRFAGSWLAAAKRQKARAA